jgi:tryptophan 2,3-dioxygenase
MKESKADTYTSYLALDEILGTQRPLSDEHDEILFIVVHQVYELWFKELLHELAYLQRLLEGGQGPQALSTLKRVLTILKLVVAQIDVIETLTPVQFLSFRDRLQSASGFQSAQFREVEAVLGRRDRNMIAAYEEGSEPYKRIEEALARRSLNDSFLRYLVLCGHEIPPTAWSATLRCLSGSRVPCRRRFSMPTGTTARRRRCANAWSTSTRVSRSGATAT